MSSGQYLLDPNTGRVLAWDANLGQYRPATPQEIAQAQAQGMAPGTPKAAPQQGGQQAQAGGNPALTALQRSLASASTTSPWGTPNQAWRAHSPDAAQWGNLLGTQGDANQQAQSGAIRFDASDANGGPGARGSQQGGGPSASSGTFMTSLTGSDANTPRGDLAAQFRNSRDANGGPGAPHPRQADPTVGWVMPHPAPRSTPDGGATYGGTYGGGVPRPTPRDANGGPGGPNPYQPPNLVGWQAGNPDGRNLTDDMRAYYTHEDPQAYYRQYVGDLANPDTTQGRYAQSKFSQAWADYLKAAQNNDNLLFPDFLTGQYGKGLMQGFANLGWQDRGEAAPTVNAGRVVW